MSKPKTTQIRVTESTLVLLKNRKVHPRETMDQVIVRILEDLNGK